MPAHPTHWLIPTQVGALVAVRTPHGVGQPARRPTQRVAYRSVVVGVITEELHFKNVRRRRHRGRGPRPRQCVEDGRPRFEGARFALASMAPRPVEGLEGQRLRHD